MPPTPSSGPILSNGSMIPILDQLMATVPMSRRSGLSPWTLVRVLGTFPSAWVAREVHEAPDWKGVFLVLSENDALDQAWFEPATPTIVSSSQVPAPLRKKLERQLAIVEHDGPCILDPPARLLPGMVLPPG